MHRAYKDGSQLGNIMKAAVLYGPGDLRVECRPLPQARPGWVVLAVETAGICGTDVAVYEGRYPASLPLVLGHEFAGHVLVVGQGVSGLREGQRVIAEGSWQGGQGLAGGADCRQSCMSPGALGRTIDGCFAEAVAVPAVAVHVLPDNVSIVAAQSAVTLATAVHAAERAGDLAGRRIAIIGPGHAGLLLLQVCREAGAREIVVLGTRDSRLAVATNLGADYVVNVRTVDFEYWRHRPGNDEFEVTFEASGTPAGLAQAFALTRYGGTVVSYGIINGPLDGVHGGALYSKELAVLGSRGAGARYAEAICLLALGKVCVEPLVSHQLSLDEAVRGFTLMTQRLENALRVVFTPGKAGLVRAEKLKTG
ncbi:MAG: zinc-binding dehydrogenase [Chloroflexi bacterium]|nr:zinc-binding dehydrogenase [Chloroflexota bacterium]